MHLLRCARSFSFALAAGSVPLLLALSLHSQPAPVMPVPGTLRQVSDALDRIIQPRFQDVTAGQFGLGRLSPAVRGHQAIGFEGYFRTTTPAEAALLASAEAAHHPYIMAFLHCAHVLGEAIPKTPQMMSSVMRSDVRPRLITISVSGVKNGFPAGYMEKTEPVLRQAALLSLPSAIKGKNVQTAAGGWTLFLRPIAASQATCLSCHTGTKRGDTLGVMVYAVGRASKPTPQ